ncbi:hypothetical protein H7X46_27730 [Pseudonocardia sp. C8]|uniref:hypothetical protein n=1 Tax=Pseudonocardia sp. C8 TaxID=2762759 RepID=UPI001642F6AB|nr:hypothetical protein [Pseudonocardia sp. C8]MBC3194847.1 hypothetical protein [Pseudonocardia sp. C8]
MTALPSGSDQLTSWAERLADRVAPDEVDLAPDLIAAYVEGGSARRELFAGVRADPGAFGAGTALFLPTVLDVIHASYITIKAFIGDPAINTLVASASLGVALRSLRASRPTPTSSNDSLGDQQPSVAARRPDDTGGTEAPSEVVERAATAVVDVRDRLDRTGSDPAATATAAAAMEVVAADPAAAAAFLDRARNAAP